jgi:hypothetical protein
MTNVVDMAQRRRKSEPPPPIEGWEGELLLTPKGKLRANIANVITILFSHRQWAGRVAFD